MQNNHPDIVYILRDKPSKWQHNEIRFSLRSLEKYFPHGKVFVVSESLPEWMRNVEHIPAVDGFENKLANAITKIRAACRDARVSERFVLMNDDFFFLRPVPELMPATLGRAGTLEEMAAEHKTSAGYYYAATIATRDILHAAGHEKPKAYELHYPMAFEKSKFIACTDAVKWEEVGYLFRSLYGNTYALGGKPRKDTKAFTADTIGRYEDFLSITEAVALYPKFQKFIFGRFPEPSQYEDPASAPTKLP